MKNDDIVSTRIEVKRESLSSNVALRVWNLLSLNSSLEIKVSQLEENTEIRKKKKKERNRMMWFRFQVIRCEKGKLVKVEKKKETKQCWKVARNWTYHINPAAILEFINFLPRSYSSFYK